MIKYTLPDRWIKYSHEAVAPHLAQATGSVLALQAMPYQKEWVLDLQRQQLKREVAGTSRIEGAEFTESELDQALGKTAEDLFTRSQRQARAATRAYEWIGTLENDLPIGGDVVREIHRRMVTGADDDRCEPGGLRGSDQNVSFGIPRHRGIEGGEKCEEGFSLFCQALQTEFPSHDSLVQALAAHYHLAAMHPFLDGNGRTARALESLFAQRAGLRDITFIPMSNYHYDEKTAYLAALAEVRQNDHDLTAFLVFGLRGFKLQCERLLAEIKVQVAKALFVNQMHDLFGRLKSPRKRVVGERQVKILQVLLEKSPMLVSDVYDTVDLHYQKLENPGKAIPPPFSSSPMGLFFALL